MAEKRERRSPGSSSLPATQNEPSSSSPERKSPAREPAQDAVLFEEATRLLHKVAWFDKQGVFVGTSTYDAVPLQFPRDLQLVLEFPGESFTWNGHLIASLDQDDPGTLILYMPHERTTATSIQFRTRKGWPGFVEPATSDIVAYAYQCITRLLICVQEMHKDADGWSVAHSAVHSTEALPTMRASDPSFVEAGSRLSFYPVASSPPLLWPEEQDFVVDVQPVSAGGFACTVLQRHQSGRLSLVRVTSKVTLNDKNLHVQHCLATHFAPYVPRVVGPDRVPLGQLDARVLKALRANQECGKFDWLQPKANHMNVSVSVMAYAEEGDLSDYIQDKRQPIDWSVAFRLLCFLYSAQALLGFEHGDFKASNIVLTRMAPLGATTNGGPPLVPQIIDFDYANFHPLKVLDSKRRIGSPWTMPPEFFDPTAPAAWRTVLGAADVWALGAVLLGWRVGIANLFLIPGRAWVNEDYITLYGEMDTQNAVIQTILKGAGLPNAYDDAVHGPAMLTAHRYYKRLVALLQTLSVDEHNFFSQMLHLNPLERIHHGRLYELIAHPVFDRWISAPDKTAILADAVQRHFPQGGLPSTLQASEQQLCALIEGGYALEEELICTRCTAHRAHYLSGESGRVVCGDCSE